MVSGPFQHYCDCDCDCPLTRDHLLFRSVDSDVVTMPDIIIDQVSADVDRDLSDGQKRQRNPE